MGFWKRLLGLEEIPQGLPKPARVEQAMPIISEPVLSIIQTLKNGEWSFKEKSANDYHPASTGRLVIFTHEWFGNSLYLYKSYLFPSEFSCYGDWMTEYEKNAVSEVCWQIYEGRVQWEKEQSLAKQRESFMCLVKEEE